MIEGYTGAQPSPIIISPSKAKLSTPKGSAIKTTPIIIVIYNRLSFPKGIAEDKNGGYYHLNAGYREISGIEAQPHCQ